MKKEQILVCNANWRRIEGGLKMKQKRLFTGFSLMVICVFFGLSATISVRGGDALKVGAVNPSTIVQDRFDLEGAVIDNTPDISQVFDKIEAATPKSEEEFLQAFKGMPLPQPVPNLAVTARGGTITEKAVTDSQGKFQFIGLPRGVYELSAEMLSRSAGMREGRRMATAKERVNLDTNRRVNLRLRTDLVNVKGRITDANGKPVAGAKVRGEYYPWPESAELAKFYPTHLAVSDADGSYELSEFVPQDIRSNAGYLMGGDPTQNNQYPFYVEVHVEADGFIQDKTNVPRVPLVTEELLGPARRFLEIMNKLDILMKGSSNKVEKKDLRLPSSQGNTITGIDIVLKKSGEAAQ